MCNAKLKALNKKRGKGQRSERARDGENKNK